MNDYQRLVLSDQSDTILDILVSVANSGYFSQFIISAWALIGQAYFALQLPSGQTERKATAMFDSGCVGDYENCVQLFTCGISCIACAAICRNCATLHTDTCRCSCADGWYGTDCSGNGVKLLSLALSLTHSLTLSLV